MTSTVRRYSGAGLRRGGRPPATGGHVIPNPGTILGSLYHMDFRADDPNRVMGSGADIAGFFNYGLDASDALQASASARPQYGATTFNGGPGATFDGTNDELKATLNTAIALGARPYVWLVGSWVGSSGTAAAVTNAGATAGVLTFASTNVHAQRNAEDNNSGVAVGTGRHLIEIGFTASGTACLVVDGVAVNGTDLTAGAALTQLVLGSYGGGGFANFVFARVVVTNGAPSGAMVTAMRTYLKGNNFANYSGSNYGLP